MNEDRISGSARNLGGKVEEGVGRATGDVTTQLQGKLDQAAGAAQDLYGQATDAARDTAMNFDKWLRRRAGRNGVIGTKKSRLYGSVGAFNRAGKATNNRDSAVYHSDRGSRHRLAPWQDASTIVIRPCPPLRLPVAPPMAPLRLHRSGCSSAGLSWSGFMLASDIARHFYVKSARARQTATAASGTSQPATGATTAQHARARGTGRGRQGETPWQIPWKGWKDIFWRTYRQTGEDRLLAVAGGVVFYGLLAVFPAVTALASLYGLFASPVAIGDHLSLAAGMLPQSSIDILRDHINQLTSGGGAKLGLGFIFGLAVAMWSANAGMKAIMDALNVVYEEQEMHSMLCMKNKKSGDSSGSLWCRSRLRLPPLARCSWRSGPLWSFRSCSNI